MSSAYAGAAQEALLERQRRRRERQGAVGAPQTHAAQAHEAPAKRKRAAAAGAEPTEQAVGRLQPADAGGSAARVRQQKAHSHPPAGTSEAPTKRQKLMASVHLRPVVLTPAAKCALAFDSDWHDHCETPFEAYRDIEPLLFQLATRLGLDKASLRVYDPYFCEGSMVAHLARLGFTNVHNVNEDCYAAWESGRTPEYDVLITNPPYSGDHMQRILSFAVASGKPWLLLLPNFVAYKKSFRELVPEVFQPSFLVPSKRYVYYAPGRQEASTQPTSPFDSFWYLCFRSLGSGAHDALCAWWERKYARASGATLARTRELLPAMVTPVRDEKRANPRARKRAAKRQHFLHKLGIAHAHVRHAKK
jgi:hypothetical protein